MDKIIKKFCIKKHKKGFYNLNNIVKNIIKSKSPTTYMDKITNKKSIGTIFYITEEQFIQILKKSRSVNGKEAYKLLKNQTVEEKNEIVDTKIDSNNNLFSFNNKGLKVVHVGDEIWFKGKDVAKILEYTDFKQAVRKNIDDDDKITAKKLRKLENIKEIEKLKGEQPHTIFINFNGFRNILIKSRKPMSIPLAEKFNIDLLTKIQCKEAEVLNYIIQLCKIKNIIYDLQFSCGDYSIDMYIHKYKLAIEIDENNHSDRDPEYEKNREEFIKNTLNCKFIRFDPDGKDCFISQLILDLLKIFNDKEKMTKYQSAIQKEKSKQSKYQLEVQSYQLEAQSYQLEAQKEISKQMELKIKLEIEKRKTIRASRELNINEEIIEDSEVEESDYKQDSDADTTSSESPETNDSESKEEPNKLKTNKCLDCDTSIYKSSKRCIKCNSKLRFKMGTQKRKVIKRPSHKQLKKDLENSSYVQVGKKYNVSDNSIRKWLKTYEKYKN
jgi:very-short-patch-repair endonuclease